MGLGNLRSTLRLFLRLYDCPGLFPIRIFTSAGSYVKLLDSYIKQQRMNNFSLVAFTQIRHFGSLIPNIFSIYKFVFLINAYM